MIAEPEETSSLKKSSSKSWFQSAGPLGGPQQLKFPDPIASVYDIYWLGLTIVLGGQLIYWNQGFHEGFWSFFGTTVMVGSGYLCLTFCLAEMTSVLPFAGGSYGYVRCTMGPIAGYVCGCCEGMEYVLYVATSLAEFGSIMTIVLSSSKTYEPLFWFGFYVIALSIHIRGGKLFWIASDIAAMVTFVLIVLYLLGSSTVANFSEHATDHDTYSASQFFLYFPLPSWFFVGVEALTLACENIAQPTRNVPRAMVFCVLTLIITALCIVFVSASVAPGAKAVADAYLPFNFGFSQYFGISDHLAAILNLPGMFATAFGFMFAYGRQLFAMSRSKLLPTFLSEVYGQQQTPISSLITGSICGMAVLLILFFNFDSFTKKLFNLCMLGSCIVYLLIFRAYLICTDRYRNLGRSFINPFGVWGAYYGLAIFGIMTVSLAFFQNDGYESLIVFTSFVTFALIYYFAVVRKREFLSDEEQRDFWKAYLINATLTSQRRVLKPHTAFLRILPQGSGSHNSPRSFLEPFPWPSGRDPQSDSRVNPWSEATTERSRSSLQDRFRALGPFYTSLRNDAESVISGEMSSPNQREPLLRRSFRWEDVRISLSETSTIGLYQQPCKIPSVPLLPLDEIGTHVD